MWPLLIVSAGAQPAAPPPSEQTLVYYNARLALQDGEPDEVVRLWLLRNALYAKTRRVSAYDDAFRSVVWVAMSELDLCSDGFATDEAGSGLWPIALHNRIVSGDRPDDPRPAHFARLQDGRQQRAISMHSVLGTEELRSVNLRTTRCYQNSRLHTLLDLDGSSRDPSPATRLAWLTHLLTRSRDTLGDDVSGTALIEARLFDLHLAQMEEADLPAESEAAQILNDSTSWTPQEWMALSPERRRFLFDQARDHLGPNDALDALAIELVDAVALAGEGDEVGEWIARCPRNLDRQRIWSGATGELLLAMGPESRFRERAVLSLHRGVAAAEMGRDADAVTAFATALRHAPDSSHSQQVAALSRRWLFAIVAEFTPTAPLLDRLVTTLPEGDAADLVEQLLWTTALRADADGFERLTQTDVLPRRADRTIALLHPLAVGDSGGFIEQVEHGLSQSPRSTLRLLTEYVHRLESERTSLRATHVQHVFTPLADRLLPGMAGEWGTSHRRPSIALWDRLAATARGVGARRGAPESLQTRGPEPIAHVGTVRVLPTDPLPWPFLATRTRAPSVLQPLHAEPLTWEDDGQLTFGWQLSE